MPHSISNVCITISKVSWSSYNRLGEMIDWSQQRGEVCASKHETLFPERSRSSCCSSFLGQVGVLPSFGHQLPPKSISTISSCRNRDACRAAGGGRPGCSWSRRGAASLLLPICPSFLRPELLEPRSTFCSSSLSIKRHLKEPFDNIQCYIRWKKWRENTERFIGKGCGI